ncbi:cytochrome P450 [Actinomadura welshii]|nr:cytochrome P450 [Actinomadura madurae]
MRLASDHSEKIVLYPAEEQARYVREGLWESPTIAEHLHLMAREHGDRDALVCGDARLTFAELDRVTDRRAAGLHRLGLEPGGAVLLQVHNTVNTVIAWYALLKAGLVPVCTLPLHRGHEIGEIARQTRPVAHLVAARDPRFDLVGFAFRQAEAAGVERTVLVSDGRADDPRAVELDGLGDDIDGSEARRTVEGIQAGLGMQSLAVFQLSGGTTGVPKVIPCLQAPYWHYGASLARAMGWGPGDRVAYMMPIVHNAGVIIGLQGPHSVGATLVLGVPDASAALDLVVRNGATDVLLGPFAFDLALDPDLAAATTLRRVLFSGKKVPGRHMAALEARGIWGGQIFGMSEGLCLTTPPGFPPEARAASVGVPISPADEIRLYEPGTEKEVAPGEVGELCARGPYTLHGYYDAAEHDRRAFTADGFYRTGDLMAERTIAGVRCYTVEGRVKNMISRGGEKINTEEIELLLGSHDAIAEAALVAMPDERLGERACAFVVTRDGREIDLAEVRAHFELLEVAKYKWPERIVVLPEMPRVSQVGKIDRRRLREIAETLGSERGGAVMTTGDPAFDHLDRTLSAEDVRRAHAEMREACPVVHSDRHGGFDFLTRYGDVRAALTDTGSFSSADGVHIPPSRLLPPVPALEFDEPEHAQWRRVLDGPLTPRAVRAFEPVITEIVDLLIDDFATAGQADLVCRLTEPLPAIVIGRMIGLDQAEAVRARGIAAALFAAMGTDEFPARFAEFSEHTRRWLADRRENPRDDMLTEMAGGVVQGKEIDEAGATGLLLAYIVGGHHSTGSALGGLIRHVLTVPGLRDGLLADRRGLPRVIEESLRLTTPLQLFARTLRCPVRVGDRDLAEGGRVLLDLAAANRDPREFGDPEEFDPRRTRNRHVSFGAGPHVCQGQHLARAELRITLTRLLDRLPDLRLDGEPVETGLVGGSLMTHAALPVAFTPENAG